MKDWDVGEDHILMAIAATLEGLESGRMPVAEARQRAWLLRAATKREATFLDHAKATGRLVQGSAELPTFHVVIGKPRVKGNLR